MTPEEKKAQEVEIAKQVKEGIAEAMKSMSKGEIPQSQNSFTKRTYGLVSKKKTETIAVEKDCSGFVILEFIKDHGTKKEGDEETYHVSTATALVKKLKVAKVVKQLKKYVPKKEKK